MTQATTADLTDPVYAQLLAKITLLEQEKEQLKQHYEQQIAHLYQQLVDALEKQKLLTHKIFSQSSERISGKQHELLKETALEDQSALEQHCDNFLDGLSDDERAKLQITSDSQATQTQDNSAQSATDDSQNGVKPKRPKRIVIPDHLPIKVITHSPKTTTCDCGCQMRHMGDDVQDKLGFIPKQFFRERHIYPKWVCGNCQTLIQAHTEAQIIDKSIGTPELFAHILISKYADHLPLYRQNIIYQRSGVDIPASTLSDWVGRCGVALEPLVKRLHELMLTQAILHADETPVTIMKFNGKSPKQGYVWAYVTPQHIQQTG